MMFLRVLIVCVAMLVSGPVEIRSETICDLDDTESTCRLKIEARFAQEDVPEDQLDSVVSAEREEAIEGSEEALARKNTGASGAQVLGPSSTLNFNPLINLLLQTDGLEDSDDSGQLFSLDLNHIFGGADKNYKFQIVGRDPSLYPPIISSIAEDAREERAGQLGELLNRFDDLSLVISYSPFGEFFGRVHGRDIALYRGEFATLFESVRDSFVQEIENRRVLLAKESNRVFKRLISEEGPWVDSGDQPFRSISNQELAQEYLASFEAAAVARYQRRAELRQALDDTQFFRFTELVDNQPQLSFSLEQTDRNQLVGPNELKVGITYEVGWSNVNSLLGECGSPAQSFSRCFEQYVRANEKSIKAGNRVAFSAAYSDVEDFDFGLLGDGVELQEDGVEKLLVSLAYGRYLSFSKTGENMSKIDLSWSYEDVSNDPSRQNRSLAAAILSLPMADGTTFQVGLHWASEPEFQGEVDKELSARLGLTYKLGGLGKGS